ncbi:arginine--tRNA ligase, partial [Candidatus Woesearchaeota archaeon]|nr:arginine--tRNA ligase [Candidatus Woesearchaeota archaeon]
MEYFKKLVAKSISNSAPFNSDKILELLEYPDKTNRGDISLPCFTLSKKLNPGNVAINLRKKITLPKQIERCEVMGPYLNFFIKKEELTKRVSRDIRSKTSKYGSTNLGKSKKIVIEH